jgi:hypothetical protein
MVWVVRWLMQEEAVDESLDGFSVLACEACGGF